MQQRAPIDYVLAQPLSETLMVAGFAETVMAAHVMAQSGLAAVLGGDSVEAWSLKAMDHVYTPEKRTSSGNVLRGAGVEFQAQFVRNPEYEAEDAA